MRTYRSLCIESGDKCVRVNTNKCISCPDLNYRVLEKEINDFINYIAGRSGSELIEITRIIATQALSTSLTFRPVEKRGE